MTSDPNAPFPVTTGEHLSRRRPPDRYANVGRAIAVKYEATNCSTYQRWKVF